MMNMIQEIKISEAQGEVLIQKVRSHIDESGSAWNLEKQVRWLVRIVDVSQL